MAAVAVAAETEAAASVMVTFFDVGGGGPAVGGLVQVNELQLQLEL